jgi:small multidrug resistance family-3 protein
LPKKEPIVELTKIAMLYFFTAVAEIVGCYLPYLWLRQGKSAWLLLPAAACLAVFVWLLTLHPQATGRVYAAYGGVYVAAALIWLWLMDGATPTRWDIAGVAITLAGMMVIVLQPQRI